MSDQPLDPSIQEKVIPVDRSHQSLKCGDTDPELNKKLAELILCTQYCIVYLADDQSVQWRTASDHEQTKHNGKILGSATTLESKSSFIQDKVELAAVRRLIAESIARCLDGDAEEVSTALLRAADLRIADRSKEMAWMWYFLAAYCVTAGCVALGVSFWLERDALKALIGVTAFEVTLGVLTGAVGALLSTTSRGNRLVLDANAGKAVHQLEGLSRIGAGLIGAFLVALCLEGGLIVGGAHFAGSRLCTLLAFCLVAGASERLVPSLISNVERAAVGRVSR